MFLAVMASMVVLALGQNDDQSVVMDFGNISIAASSSVLSIDLHNGNSASYESNGYVTTFIVGKPQGDDKWKVIGSFPVERNFNASVEVLESVTGKLMVTIITDRKHVVNDETESGQMFTMNFPGMSQDDNHFPGSMFFLKAIGNLIN
jgi:hypothetical protein